MNARPAMTPGRLRGGRTGQDRSRPCGPHRERGSATVLLLAVIVVALTLTVGAVALARAAHARGVAQTAADLAAIAAAETVQQLGGAPCAVAAAVAAANHAVLTGCTEQPAGLVEVSTAVATSPLPGWSTVATAQARAGPVR